MKYFFTILILTLSIFGCGTENKKDDPKPDNPKPQRQYKRATTIDDEWKNLPEIIATSNNKWNFALRFNKKQKSALLQVFEGSGIVAEYRFSDPSLVGFTFANIILLNPSPDESSEVMIEEFERNGPRSGTLSIKKSNEQWILDTNLENHSEQVRGFFKNAEISEAYINGFFTTYDSNIHKYVVPGNCSLLGENKKCKEIGFAFDNKNICRNPASVLMTNTSNSEEAERIWLERAKKINGLWKPKDSSFPGDPACKFVINFSEESIP